MTLDANAAIAALAERLRASTVRVHDERGRGSGSGVVWDGAGTIVTNAHVVRGRSATVEWNGGSAHARVERRDDARDLAALRIDDRTLPRVATRPSRGLVPGELVVAVGNPLGLKGAVTAGVVQRCNARWVVADVRLAPGNSGGPLADHAGRVVGINSMVANGLALAIPSEAVDAFLAARVEPERLGLALAPVALRGARGRVPAWLVLDVVAGGRAERAGVRQGDAIVGTDRGPLGDAPATGDLAGATTLEIVRGGAGRTIVVPPGEGARAA